MKVSEALKHGDTNMRLSYGDRWLIWNGEWEVVERLPYARFAISVVRTKKEEVAIRYLINDPDITG